MIDGGSGGGARGQGDDLGVHPQSFLGPVQGLSHLCGRTEWAWDEGTGASHISVSEVALLLRSRFPKTNQDPPPGAEEVVPEVVGAFPLPEAAARYDTDARLLQELHAVEHVRGHLVGLRTRGRT